MMGDLKPCHRWSHGYSKDQHEGSDWYFHPHTLSFPSLQQQPAWETNVLLSGAFSRGRPKLCPATIAAIRGWSRSPTLIFILVLSLFSLETNYSATHFGGWELALRSVWHSAHRHKKHDSICTLYLWPPDHNNISGQFSFIRSSWC